MSSEVFRGIQFGVQQQSIRRRDGGTFTAEWVTRADGVRILARDHDGRLLISNEYRHELNARDLRLPGGKVENGHTPREAAEAELQEETGMRARSFLPVASTQAFATVRYTIHYFEARELVNDPIAHDEDEDIEVLWATLAEAFQMALDGRIGEDLSALQIIRLAWREGVACRG